MVSDDSWASNHTTDSFVNQFDPLQSLESASSNVSVAETCRSSFSLRLNEIEISIFNLNFTHLKFKSITSDRQN